MNRRNVESEFFDDDSSMNFISGYYDSSTGKDASSDYFESNGKSRSNRQTNATLGNLLENYEDEPSRPESFFNESDIYPGAGPSYDDATAGVEKQVANLKYVESPKPLYDPYQSKGMVQAPSTAVMMTPVLLEQRNHHTRKPSNQQNSPRNEPVPQNVDHRIKELKMEINNLDHEIEKDEKKTRKSRGGFCYCCPTTRRGKFVLFTVITVIIGILALLAYLFWPKIPEFKVKTLQSYGNGPRPNIDFSNFRINYALNLTAEVKNENRYAFKTDSIIITTYISPNMSALRTTKYPGNLLTGKVDDYRVGNASLLSSRFLPGTTKTLYLNFTIDYVPDPDLGISQDPAIGEILRVCSKEGRDKKVNMKIVYEVEVKIGFLSKLGIYPKITDEAIIGCPLPASAAEELSLQFAKISQGNSNSEQ